MAIASYLTPELVLEKGLRVSNATILDLIEYDPKAYARMTMVYSKDQDAVLTNSLFPKASIELLLMLEDGWWANFIGRVSRTTLWAVDPHGNLVTGFKPECLVKDNIVLKELEMAKVIERFWRSTVSDNANINEKDKFNWEMAKQRFDERWETISIASHFYDVDQNGMISKIEENNLLDPAYFRGNRRYY